MSSPHATLRLEPAVVTHVFLDGNVTRHPESHFLDLVIGDRSLRSIAGERARDLVTELNRPWLREVPDAVDRFLGRRSAEFLGPGRIPLLVCAVDGDLGCGQLTAAVRVAADVTWSDFMWEDGSAQPSPAGLLDGSVRFDRAQYEATFAEAYERVAAFPYDERAHRGRRFLWPWQWGWKLPRDD